MPGTSFSSLLITTDVPLLFFWSLALLALAKLRSASSIGWAIVLGLALGFGLLSKYAMLYFVLGAGLALLSNADGRRLIASRSGLIALAVALIVFAPNIIWNITHQFETVSHTAANANIGGGFKLSKLFEFLGAQIGIIGPIAMGLLIWGIARGWMDRALRECRHTIDSARRAAAGHRDHRRADLARQRELGRARLRLARRSRRRMGCEAGRDPHSRRQSHRQRDRRRRDHGARSQSGDRHRFWVRITQPNDCAAGRKRVERSRTR